MTLKKEFCRKFFHFLLALVPLIYLQIGRPKSVIILGIIAVITVGLDYLRRKNQRINYLFVKIFGLVLRDHELTGEKLSGAGWVSASAFLNFLLFEKEIAVIAFLILVFSDGLSALVGKSFPSRPFFEKSLSGAATFFISGLVILVLCGTFFHVKILFYAFGLFALFCTTLIESRPSLLKIDDNFTVPLTFSIVMTFFDLIWNYL